VHLYVPALAVLALGLPHLDQGDFRTDTQWYSAIGLQAWRTGNLWTLYAEPGLAYFNKPPLVLWIHGLSLHVLGPSLVAARLPAVLAALITVLATAFLVRRLAGTRAALLSGLVLTLTLEFIRRVREISLDMWLVAFLMVAAAAVVCLLQAPSRQRRAACAMVAGMAIGAALLCKPLLGLIALPVFAVWLVAIGRAAVVPLLGLVAAVAVAVAAPWHLSMAAIHGSAFTDQYFGREIAQRAAGRLNADASTPLFYLIQLGETYWPWLFPVLGVPLVYRRLPLSHRRLVLLAGVWSVAWLVLLSVFPDRRSRYALVVWPMLAALAGVFLSAAPLPRLRRGVSRIASRAGLVVVLLGVVFSILPVRWANPPEPGWSELFAWIRAGRHEGSSDPRWLDLWQGSLIAHRSSRLYVEFGRWPRPTRDRRGEIIVDQSTTPPEGALLVYQRDDALGPGVNETVVFEVPALDGKGRPAPPWLRVTRLGAGGWNPRPTSDGLAW
jgi:4-amino-4-deoxy-L-arabinose transferase-like glycosyltransferase